MFISVPLSLVTGGISCREWIGLHCDSTRGSSRWCPLYVLSLRNYFATHLLTSQVPLHFENSTNFQVDSFMYEIHVRKIIKPVTASVNRVKPAWVMSTYAMADQVVLRKATCFYEKQNVCFYIGCSTGLASDVQCSYKLSPCLDSTAFSSPFDQPCRYLWVNKNSTQLCSKSVTTKIYFPMKMCVYPLVAWPLWHLM